MTFVYRSPEVGESEYGPCPGAGLLVEQDGEHRFLIAEMGVPTDRLPLPQVARQRLRSSVVLSGMGRDASTGAITFDGRELRTTTGRSLDPELFGQLQSALAEIARGYRPRWSWVNPPGGPDGRWLMTVHPFGGASIASRPEEGVVDHTGQVFENRGLYVADASLFPRAPGLPPAMTIAALAERQAALLLQTARA